MSRPKIILIDLGLVSFACYLWLYWNTGFGDWWQLASFFVWLAVIVMITDSYKKPTTGILLVGFLAVIGWLFVSRIDPNYSLSHWRGLMLGGVAYLIALNIDWHDLRYKYINGLVVLLLLVITLVFGDIAGGAKAWLSIGGLRFQPIEIARIFLLLFLAGYFYDYRELLNINKKWPEIRYWGPVFLLMIGVFLFLAVQRDLGPALLFYCLFISLVLYISFNWYQVTTYILITVTGLVMAWYSFPHIRQRVVIWLNPWSDPTGAGYQIVQGLLAINAGGILGTGLGLGGGSEIPAVHTDYIFALIGEELGFIGTVLILIVYCLLLFYGIQLARNLTGKSHVLGICIVLLWGYQIFIVIGGILTLIPLSGMTLPFISYGSSSLVVNMWILGLLTSLATSGQESQLSNGFKNKSKKIFIFILILFALLGFSLGYWQLFRPDLKAHPNNPRSYAMFQSRRGTIYDRNGELLAYTTDELLGFRRNYVPPENLSHTIGYFHHRYGITGLELSFNQQLIKEQDIYLTIDRELELKVAQLMEGHVGATIVMRPATGELLAINSTPAIDSNLLNQQWASYVDRTDGPFFNRALSGRYPPGSVIKPLLLAVAYQTNLTTPDTIWDDRGSIDFGERVLRNFRGNAYGSITTQEALAVSSNIVFAQLATNLRTDLLDYLSDFGIGQAWAQLGISTRSGNLPSPNLSLYGWAQLGIGQGEILVTPLEMAVAISAIANGGVRMEPYLVREIGGNWFTKKIWRPRSVGQVLTQHNAALVRDAMFEAVENGTASGAYIPGTEIAGKTGTAENPHGDDHSWFVGIGSADEFEIVVVVIVEHGGAGSGIATEIAKEIFRYAL